METVKKNPFIKDSDYDRYADAFYIVSKNEEFELALTTNEYKAKCADFVGNFLISKIICKIIRKITWLGGVVLV